MQSEEKGRALTPTERSGCAVTVGAPTLHRAVAVARPPEHDPAAGNACSLLLQRRHNRGATCGMGGSDDVDATLSRLGISWIPPLIWTSGGGWIACWSSCVLIGVLCGRIPLRSELWNWSLAPRKHARPIVQPFILWALRSARFLRTNVDYIIKKKMKLRSCNTTNERKSM